MKWLADEGVDRQIVDELRLAGHDVRYVAEMSRGTGDPEILEFGRTEKRVLLTADKDFGELVFRQRKATGGVLLVRLAGLAAQEKAKLVARVVGTRGAELSGSFAVLTPTTLRIRHSMTNPR